MNESLEAITYDWLKANGFHTLERAERQPFTHARRCLGMDVIGELFMAASEDLCIDLSPCNSRCEKWACWITRAHASNGHPSQWIHVRTMHYTAEVVALYEGLTGRKFGPIAWRQSDRQEPLFPEVIHA